MSSTQAQSSRVVLLLVEDNIAHAEIIRRTLDENRLQADVHHVIDGSEALDFLYQRGAFVDYPRPTLILLDLRLPKIDGLEVLRQIKHEPKLKNIPVVILSSSRAEEDIIQAYDQRANSYLVKPVDYSAFSAMMHDLGLYWFLWNESPLA